MFIPGGSTQDEIMAIALTRMRLTGSEVVVDVGCGTGKVSLAMSKSARHVYAIDRREEAVSCAREKATEAGAENITFLRGEATDLLPNLPRLDGAFIGGSRDLSRVLSLLAGIVNGPVVMNAVLITTLGEGIAAMKKYDMFREALHVQVARTHELGGSYLFRPIDPVYIIVGECRTC